MKIKTGLLVVMISWFFLSLAYGNGNDPISLFIMQTELELQALNQDFQYERNKQEIKLNEIQNMLFETRESDIMLKLLVDKIKIEKELKVLGNEFRIKLAERRYRKGIELIRLLYEKIIGLEYHFSAVESNQSLMELANPTTFPEFAKIEKTIAKRLRKKSGLTLPGILQNNPYAASSFSLASVFMGEGSRKEKERDLENISCILDFTIQMNTDLKIIYFETEYLKSSNLTLKEDCISLFNEYTKVIGYEPNLVDCRDNDDWDNVMLKLGVYVEEMRKQYAGSPEEVKLAFKKNSSLEFPFMLMTAFIHKYNNFIAQGKNYYRKFGIIMGNYQHKTTCESILPDKFKLLVQEIQHSVQKFDEAYNIPELKGSKLKDLLYGYDD